MLSSVVGCSRLPVIIRREPCALPPDVFFQPCRLERTFDPRPVRPPRFGFLKPQMFLPQPQGLAPFIPAVASGWAVANLINSIEINLILAVFNMIPIPPLDGGRVAVGVLPNALAFPLARMERVGFLLIIIVMLVFPLGSLIGPPVAFLFDIIAWTTGHG